jgi:hypothetical protein
LGSEAPTWLAVFLPRGASEPIIRKLNQAAFATADTPSVQERLNVLSGRRLAQPHIGSEPCRSRSFQQMAEQLLSPSAASPVRITA